MKGKKKEKKKKENAHHPSIKLLSPRFFVVSQNRFFLPVLASSVGCPIV